MSETEARATGQAEAFRLVAEEVKIRTTRYVANPSVVSALRSLQRWCESMATEAQS